MSSSKLNMAVQRPPAALTSGSTRCGVMMSPWWAAVALVVPTLSGLVWRWFELRFLHRVYERGGAKDLKVAAEALRTTRSQALAEKLPRAGKVLRRGRDQGEQ